MVPKPTTTFKETVSFFFGEQEKVEERSTQRTASAALFNLKIQLASSSIQTTHLNISLFLAPENQCRYPCFSQLSPSLLTHLEMALSVHDPLKSWKKTTSDRSKCKLFLLAGQMRFENGSKMPIENFNESLISWDHRPHQALSASTC